MSRYYNDELEHANREWKNHTYLKKYRGKNGKWVYVYKRKHNQAALNGNGGSTPYSSESDAERISKSAHGALNRLRDKNSRAAIAADTKVKSKISTAKRRVNNTIRDVQNSADGAINRLRDKNTRSAIAADTKVKSKISRTVNKAKKAAGNMERRRRAAQRKRKRMIRATKTKLTTAYNNAKSKAVNKTVDYLDSLFR